MPPTLSFVTLRCSDLDASKHFFETLGLEVTPVTHRDGSMHYACQAGQQLVELYPRRRGESTELRIGFHVDHLADVLQRLSDQGAEIIQTLGTPVIRYAVVRDPNGHTIELRG